MKKVITEEIGKKKKELTVWSTDFRRIYADYYFGCLYDENIN